MTAQSAELGAVDTVARTKLHPPQLRPGLLARPRLLGALREAVTTHPLTLVSAPAGYGKTTVIAALPDACPDLPVAWLSLDPSDDDPAWFLAGLIAALRRLAPGFGAATTALLASLPDPAADIRRLVGVLVNDLVAAFDHPIALVLDDLHAVDAPAVHLALDYLLERLPPDVHLVIASRHDPPVGLARLRARGQLAELRLADLRFTSEEVTAVLDAMPGPAIPPGQLATLHERAEGWPAGMILLAGALGGLPTLADRDAFLRHHLRIGGGRHVFDYLAEEVLARESPEALRFLLETSILTELTAPTCAAVTGHPGAAALLEDLYRRNLFVIALDTTGTVFRYHDLFRGVLRQRLARELPPEATRDLHRRAAQAEPDAGRAIDHLLAAGAWEEAAVAMEEVGDAVLGQGALDTLRAWIDALPDGERRRHPRLTYLLGVVAWDRWEIEHAREMFESARRDFADHDAAGAGEAEVQLATCLTALGDRDGAQPLLDRAAGAPLPHRSRVQLGITRAWHGLYAGRWQDAGPALDEALAAVEATDDARALRILGQQLQSDFVVLPGGPARVDRLRRLVETRIGDVPDPLHAYVATTVAWTHVWRGEWAEARLAAERALAVNDRFGGAEQAGVDVVDTTAGGLLAQLHAMRGASDEADALVERLECGPVAHALATPMGAHWRAALIAPLARVRLLQGRHDAARELVARLEPPVPGEWPGADATRLALRGRLALMEGRPDEALAPLRAAVEAQRRYPFTATEGLATLALARAHLDSGDAEGALAALVPVLAEHEREGTPGAIMWEGGAHLAPLLRIAVARATSAWFAADILRRLDQPVRATVPVPATGETLTAREADVLRLIARGASNQAIADALYISIHTVKRHVASLLAKLDVESRTEAAARARDLGIV